ncbi:hypothetical protein VTI28DRAFT_4310 [Corynascus sepedonium]
MWLTDREWKRSPWHSDTPNHFASCLDLAWIDGLKCGALLRLGPPNTCKAAITASQSFFLVDNTYFIDKKYDSRRATLSFDCQPFEFEQTKWMRSRVSKKASRMNPTTKALGFPKDRGERSTVEEIWLTSKQLVGWADHALRLAYVSIHQGTAWPGRRQDRAPPRLHRSREAGRCA